MECPKGFDYCSAGFLNQQQYVTYGLHHLPLMLKFSTLPHAFRWHYQQQLWHQIGSWCSRGRLWQEWRPKGVANVTGKRRGRRTWKFPANDEFLNFEEFLSETHFIQFFLHNNVPCPFPLIGFPHHNVFLIIPEVAIQVVSGTTLGNTGLQLHTESSVTKPWFNRVVGVLPREAAKISEKIFLG